jgi:hypothetical protein
MRFTGKDAATTLLVAAIVVPYVGYVVRGEMPLIQDARGMAATGLVLGLLAALVVGRAVLDTEPWHRTVLVIGTTAFGLGVGAVWTEDAVVLAAFVAAIVVTWLLGILVHTGVLRAGHMTGRTHGHV